MNISFLPLILTQSILRMVLLKVLMMFLEMGLSTCPSFPEITKLIITITGKKYKYFLSTFSVGSSDGPFDGDDVGEVLLGNMAMLLGGSFRRCLGGDDV